MGSTAKGAPESEFSIELGIFAVSAKIDLLKVISKGEKEYNKLTDDLNRVRDMAMAFALDRGDRSVGPVRAEITRMISTYGKLFRSMGKLGRLKILHSQLSEFEK